MNPYAITGPAIVNVSGGRTSAFMLRKILDAHHGYLPDDVHVVFTNTGREREETLAFVHEIAERWCVDVRWLERGPHGAVREVSHATASRKGEPFAQLIDEKRYLPNGVTRFCTVDLKIKVAAAFMHSQGYDDWTSVIGFRADEDSRVANLRARSHDWSLAFPLHAAGVHKRHVLAFWATQSFNLQLQPWESNCDGCFLKSRAVRERLARERPEDFAWWVEQEAKVGARFHSKEKGYAALLDRVQRTPMLPLVGDDGAAMPCDCHGHERRAEPKYRIPCTCGGRGGFHRLRCARVLGEVGYVPSKVPEGLLLEGV